MKLGYCLPFSAFKWFSGSVKGVRRPRSKPKSSDPVRWVLAETGHRRLM